MAEPETFVLKGYTAGRPSNLSDALVARLERLPRRAGPQRLLVVRAAAAKAEDAEAFLRQDALWHPRLKAPGVYEVDVPLDDVGRLAERKDLFAWIDVGTRLFGKLAAEGAASALLQIAVGEDAAPAERALKAVGGAVTRRGERTLSARVPAGRIAQLLQAQGIEAIEVEGAG